MKRKTIRFASMILCAVMLMSVCTLAPVWGAQQASDSYRLTLVRGTGINKVQGSGIYKQGNVITIHCVVAPGYEFVKWELSEGSGVPESKKSNYSFKMPAGDVTLKAVARSIKRTVTLKKGEGILSVSGSGKYIPGEMVTVRCSPASGYKFTRWVSNKEGFNSKDMTYTFRMPSSNITLMAKAAVKKFTVTIKKTEGIISPSGAGVYKPGDVVTVYATADKNHSFVGWYRGGQLKSNQNTYVFTMPESNVTVTAKAKQK